MEDEVEEENEKEKENDDDDNNNDENDCYLGEIDVIMEDYFLVTYTL